jgi:hypothetical protein
MRTFISILLITFLITLVSSNNTNAQDCVAIRSTGSVPAEPGVNYMINNIMLYAYF